MANFVLTNATNHIIRGGNVKVSVIIPTINNNDLLEKCLSTFRYHNWDDTEIIVVDDGSREDIIADSIKICDAYQAKLLMNNENLGFSKSVNKGILAATGDIFVLYNNDVICTQPIVEEIKKSFQIDSKIGIVGALLMYEDNLHIQHAGILKSGHNRKILVYHDGVGKTINQVPHVKIPKYMFGVTGALFAIKREMVDQIGLLSEKFFLAFEDAEYCMRAWYNGFRVYYNPKIRAIHAEGATRGNTIESKQLKGPEWFRKELAGMPIFLNAVIQYNADNIDYTAQEINRKSQEKSTSKNIVVRRTGAMGDVLFATGIIRELKKLNPDKNIHFITKKREILTNNPYLSSVSNNISHLEDYSKFYDLDNAYETQHLFSAINAYGLKVFGHQALTMDLNPEFYPCAQKYKKIKSKYIVVNMAQSWKCRTIPESYWKIIISKLRKKYRIYVVGTSIDIKPPKISNCVNMQDKLSLSDIYHLINDAEFFIGPDSGILNLAYITNVKCIGVYTCIDHHKRCFNRSAKTFILEPKMGCRFCLSHGIQDTNRGFICKSGTNECINNIDYSEIFDIIKLHGRK